MLVPAGLCTFSSPFFLARLALINFGFVGWRRQVLATNGDTHLGGEDFDQRVMQYFLKMLKKKNGTDISGDNRALQKLRREVSFAAVPVVFSWVFFLLFFE